MFFGFEERPSFLPRDVKIKKEVKFVCTREKKCSGSLTLRSVLKLYREGHLSDISALDVVNTSPETWVFTYWDGSADHGIKMNKCTATHKNHEYCWYEIWYEIVEIIPQK